MKESKENVNMSFFLIKIGYSKYFQEEDKQLMGIRMG
jgi:hypothetical protein